MRKLLMTGSVLAAFGTSVAGVSSVELVANATGTRINLNSESELLSRSRLEADGSLVLEVLGATSTLSGNHTFGSNGWFSEVQAKTVQKNGHSLLELRFKPSTNKKIAVLHREWNGKSLSFVLDRKAASQNFDLTWNSGKTANIPMASLQTQASLIDAQIKSSGDIETVEFRFDEAPLVAELIGAGSSYSILVGKSRVTAKLGKIGGDFAVSNIASGKAGAQNSINLKLKQDVRSVLLSRSGNVLLLRIVRNSPAQGLLTWTSKSGKTNQFGKSALPSDEVGSLSNASNGAMGKGTFTPDGMSGTNAATTEQMGAGGTAHEAAGLEAERRKSMEFSAQQQAKVTAQQSAEDLKNRVVYNTFGIRDPFIPLEPGDVDGGLNIDQMKVAGIIFSPTRPMAVLEHLTQPGLSVALREGDAIQNGRVLKIYRDQVVFLLEEYGVTRQFALKLQAPKGDKS